MINNEFYNQLNWLRSDHPVGLLRAENAIRTPWVANEIRTRFGNAAAVLDIGCGAGFLTNPLAKHGHKVTGIDLSASSLEAARQNDVTQSVNYIQADAYDLPFKKAEFDIVCAMDVLEHVEAPDRLVAEASRVLRPGGLFFFHTFNRNWLTYLVVIKGVEWCVKNAPKNMHVYPLFIKPHELEKSCRNCSLKVVDLRGLAPNPFTKAFWRMLWQREVPADFQFRFTRSCSTGYCGIAEKR